MEYIKSDYYKSLAEEIIEARPELHFIKDCSLRIAYREANQAKKKCDNLIFGECEKVTDKNKMYMAYDFIITIYEPNIKDWDTNRVKVLLWHELLHIGAENTDDGASTWTIPHDFEEFFPIYNAFGIGWQLRDDLPDICEE